MCSCQCGNCGSLNITSHGVLTTMEIMESLQITGHDVCVLVIVESLLTTSNEIWVLATVEIYEGYEVWVLTKLEIMESLHIKVMRYVFLSFEIEQSLHITGHFGLVCCFTPQSTVMVMSRRSVHLTTLFSWASLNKRLNSTWCTYFRL